MNTTFIVLLHEPYWNCTEYFSPHPLPILGLSGERGLLHLVCLHIKEAPLSRLLIVQFHAWLFCAQIYKMVNTSFIRLLIFSYSPRIQTLKQWLGYTVFHHSGAMFIWEGKWHDKSKQSQYKMNQLHNLRCSACQSGQLSHMQQTAPEIAESEPQTTDVSRTRD